MKFKTNINCSGCIAKVTPFLNETAGPDQWKVDTDHPDKILSIASGEASVQDVVNNVRKAGFTIEHLPE